jgi:cap1 methyltransferase
MNFYLHIENDTYENNLNNIDFKIIDRNKNLLFKTYYKTVSSEKEKIDQLEKTENWDKMKKIGNPYELIYTTYNKRRKNDSISSYIPISRSYFKMWEIYYNFDIFKKFDMSHNLIFGHLAEGPGGFMEASYNYRIKKKKTNYLNDKFYGITLKPVNDYIPDWNKIKKIFNNQENVNIQYGNLYYINDVKNYIKNFEINKAHVVTADGGFDYSANFNGQEINSCQIIYSECIISLNILKKGGCFICKVFDLFSVSMIQILYIMYCSFEKMYIYKPETSRPANSEKYIICMYYKDNLTQNDKDYLLQIIEKWQELAQTLNENDSVIFNHLKVDNKFINLLNEYNQQYMDTQLFYLRNTLNLIETKIEKEQYYDIIYEQVKNAMKWCNKYDVEINKNSIYYKKNIE